MLCALRSIFVIYRYYTGNCTAANVKAMEAELAKHIVSLGKDPMGWEEILFKTAGAAESNGTAIVASWASSSAAAVVKAGCVSTPVNATPSTTHTHARACALTTHTPAVLLQTSPTLGRGS